MELNNNAPIRTMSRSIGLISTIVSRRNIRVGGSLAVVVAGVAAFQLWPSRVSVTRTIDAVARRYVRLAVALGERDHDSLDYYVGPPAWVEGIHEHPATIGEIRASALQMLSQLQSPALVTTGNEARRRDYLIGQLTALVGRVAILAGKAPSFDVESVALFGVKVDTDLDRPRMAAIRAELDQLLGGKGDLGERYASFARSFVIPKERVVAVMSAALDGCRTQTRAHLPLPPGEAVSVTYVEGAPWSGFSTYVGHYRSVIRVNLSFALGPGEVLNLACHEGYPGHHVFNSIRDWKGHGWPEVAVQPTFSPQSLLSEGAASCALDLAFPGAKRLEFERNVLFPAAGLDPAGAARYVQVEQLIDRLRKAEAIVARDYLDQRLEFVRAQQALNEDAVMADAASTLLYFNQFRSYVVTYTVGRQMVARCVNGASHESTWKRYLALMETPDSLLPCPTP
jgi:hypothetical protein